MIATATRRVIATATRRVIAIATRVIATATPYYSRGTAIAHTHARANTVSLTCTHRFTTGADA